MGRPNCEPLLRAPSPVTAVTGSAAFPRTSYRAFDLIMAAFVAVLLISNVASSKILRLGPLTFDGGTLLFPLSYIFGDVLTEVYGYARSRRVIWVGFASSLLLAGTLAVVGWLPPAGGWMGQDAYVTILGQTPRIVLGSLVAYFAGEFVNSYTLARLKVATQGRMLWLRTIGSTLIGQAVDTGLFVSVAFAGVLAAPLLVSVVVSNYVFKVGLEALATPMTYWVVNRLKRLEGVDHFDRTTRFSPFSLGED